MKRFGLKRNNGLAPGKLQIFFLPALILIIAGLVWGVWIWPMQKETRSVKEKISSHRSELTEQKNRLREIKEIRAFAEAHGDDPLGYLEDRCFPVSAKEEIIPFLLDYLPGMKKGFYLFSWSTSHGDPKKVGGLVGAEVYRVPVGFSFNAYVVETMGFLSSLSERGGLWVDSVAIERQPGSFPSYKVRGEACFVLEER